MTKDLPWAECSVLLELRVKRFFCHNAHCFKRTFAEQFPEVVGRYARKTLRVLHKQQYLGVNVCAHVGEKLLELERIGASDTTLNRLLCQLPEPAKESIQVLGWMTGPNGKVSAMGPSWWIWKAARSSICFVTGQQRPSSNSCRTTQKCKP